jgi:hypothetical protein
MRTGFIEVLSGFASLMPTTCFGNDSSSDGVSILKDCKVARPCSANWDDMDGDERARLCGQCRKTVYNLSGLSASEAADLLRKQEGSACGRLYKRRDGTILTADCPVGKRAFKQRLTIIVAVGMVLIAFALVSPWSRFASDSARKRWATYTYFWPAYTMIQEGLNKVRIFFGFRPRRTVILE